MNRYKIESNATAEHHATIVAKSYFHALQMYHENGGVLETKQTYGSILALNVFMDEPVIEYFKE